MGILAIHAGTSAVTAAVVSARGSVVARGHTDLPQGRSAPGDDAPAPDVLWRATLAATRSCLAVWEGDPSTLTALGVATQRERVLLWDRETLGSPRQPSAGPDTWSEDLCSRLSADGDDARVRALTGQRLEPGLAGPSLTRLAAHEPHTWALVQQGRHAVGTVGSYLVARMTRGTWHLTDVSASGRSLLLDLDAGDWSADLCALFGVPAQALPEIVPTWGDLARTDPRSFLGLDLPVTGVAGDTSAALLGQACVERGDVRCRLDQGTEVLANVGDEAVRTGHALTSPAWRSPAGRTTFLVEATDPEGAPATETTVRAGAVAQLLDALPVRPRRVRVDGAAGADDRLCRALATRLGVPVQRQAQVGPAVLGAAFLAGLGAGTWGSPEELCSLWRLDRQFDPAGS